MDTETVKRIAHLARIDVADSELEPLADELGAIIGWFEQLGEVDTNGVEPMTSVAPGDPAPACRRGHRRRPQGRRAGQRARA